MPLIWLHRDLALECSLSVDTDHTLVLPDKQLLGVALLGNYRDSPDNNTHTHTHTLKRI